MDIPLFFSEVANYFFLSMTRHESLGDNLLTLLTLLKSAHIITGLNKT